MRASSGRPHEPDRAARSAALTVRTRPHPKAPALGLVLDFGMTPEDFAESRRTRAGIIYQIRESRVCRGADLACPSESWNPEARRWAPCIAAPCPGKPTVLSEREAEHLMWPEFFGGHHPTENPSL